jgi:hypothetical protein
VHFTYTMKIKKVINVNSQKPNFPIANFKIN